MKTLEEKMGEEIHKTVDRGLNVPLLKSTLNASKKGSGEVSKNLRNIVVETMRNYQALWIYDGGAPVCPSIERASIELTGDTLLATSIMLSLPIIVAKDKAMEAANEYTVSHSAMSGIVKTGLAECIKSYAKEVAGTLKEVFWD